MRRGYEGGSRRKWSNPKFTRESLGSCKSSGSCTSSALVRSCCVARLTLKSRNLGVTTGKMSGSDGTPDIALQNVSLVIKNPGCTSEEDFRLQAPIGWTVLDLKQVLAKEYEGKPEVAAQKVSIVVCHLPTYACFPARLQTRENSVSLQPRGVVCCTRARTVPIIR